MSAHMTADGRLQRRPTTSSSGAEANIGAEIVGTVTSTVKNNPKKTSMWALGLLLGVFGSGFSVSQDVADVYVEKLEEVNHVTDRDYSQARRLARDADQRYRASKGWFWSCDAVCMKNYEKYELAETRLLQIEQKRNDLIKEARSIVGIWSKFGVDDVRERFWSAWEEGKERAKQWTMLDGMFMMLSPRDRDNTIITVIMQLILQYISNLTIGIISAMFIFLINVGSLIYSYGENFVTGTLFFGLVMLVVLSVVGTYIGAIGGTVYYGTKYVIKREQARLQGGANRQRVQQGGNNRPHYD